MVLLIVVDYRRWRLLWLWDRLLLVMDRGERGGRLTDLLELEGAEAKAAVDRATHWDRLKGATGVVVMAVVDEEDEGGSCCASCLSEVVGRRRSRSPPSRLLLFAVMLPVAAIDEEEAFIAAVVVDVAGDDGDGLRFCRFWDLGLAAVPMDDSDLADRLSNLLNLEKSISITHG
ncbi:hypothetical protein ACLOJK_018667 [Asimina triloba]